MLAGLSGIGAVIGFAAAMFVAAAVVYVLASIVYSRLAPVAPLLLTSAVTIAFYPLVALLLGWVQRRVVGTDARRVVESPMPNFDAKDKSKFETFSRRSLLVSGGMTAVFAVLVGRLYQLQIVNAEIVLSGHGEPITDHVALIDERFAMHQRRAEKLYRLIAEQPRTGHELAQALWGDVAVTQAFLTLSEVIGHVDLLVNAGHVREVVEGDVIHYEATGDIPSDQLGDLIPDAPGNPVRDQG